MLAVAHAFVQQADIFTPPSCCQPHNSSTLNHKETKVIIYQLHLVCVLLPASYLAAVLKSRLPDPSFITTSSSDHLVEAILFETVFQAHTSYSNSVF